MADYPTDCKEYAAACQKVEDAAAAFMEAMEAAAPALPEPIKSLFEQLAAARKDRKRRWQEIQTNHIQKAR